MRDDYDWNVRNVGFTEGCDLFPLSLHDLRYRYYYYILFERHET